MLATTVNVLVQFAGFMASNFTYSSAQAKLALAGTFLGSQSSDMVSSSTSK